MERKLGGDTNPDYASSLILSGVARSLQHDEAAAEPLLRQALEVRKRVFPPGHLLIIAAQVRLGEVFMEEGKNSEAESLLRDAVSAARHSPFPLVAWQSAEAENALGACLARMGRMSEALPLLRNSQAALKAHPQMTFRTRALARTAAILMARGQSQKH